MLSGRGDAATQNLNGSIALREITISTNVFLVNTVTISSVELRTFKSTCARDFPAADGALLMFNTHLEMIIYLTSIPLYNDIDVPQTSTKRDSFEAISNACYHCGRSFYRSRKRLVLRQHISKRQT